MGRKSKRKRPQGPSNLPSRPKRLANTTADNDKKQWDILGLLYRRDGPDLFGVILRVHGQLDDQNFTQVFLISRKVGGKELVYGSVLHLLDKLIGLLSTSEYDLGLLHQPINPSEERIRRLFGADSTMSPEDVILQQQEKIIEDTVLLVALHFRTLNEIFSGRFRKRIRVYGVDGNAIASIPIKDLADNLVHSRYFFIRDQFICNIASATDELPYEVPFESKVDAFEFFDAVLDVIRGLRVDDFIGVLRSRMASISAVSEPRHIIFLMQNVHALSRIVNDNMESANSSALVELLLDKASQRLIEKLHKERPHRAEAVEQVMLFTTPSFKVSEDLSKRQIRVMLKVDDEPETLDIDNALFLESCLRYVERPRSSEMCLIPNLSK